MSTTILTTKRTHTGDVGYADEARCFFVVDRVKELIKYKGLPHLLLFICMLIGCAGARNRPLAALRGSDGAATPPSPVPPSTPPPSSAPPTRPARLETVRILAEHFTESRPRQALVFGDGIAIWKDEVQVRLGPGDVTRLLEAFEQAGFGGMPGFFGSGRKQLRCRVSLRSDGILKEVVQLLNGDQSVDLANLADRILDLVEGRAGSGITASSLSDGLRKVASGELAPQVFRLQVHRKPRDPARDTDGYLLSVEEGVVTARPYSRQRYGDPVSLTLSRKRLRELATTLAGHDPDSLPINLYAPEYLEVRLGVLKWNRSVLAMPFAGTTPSTHGAAQARFDRLAAELDAFAQKVLRNVDDH